MHSKPLKQLDNYISVLHVIVKQKAKRPYREIGDIREQ